MRALADPTRRAVFERIVNSDEITVVELTRGAVGHAGRHFPTSQVLEQAGLSSDERPAGRNVDRIVPSQAVWSRWPTG